jgi:hypothetical protein
MNAQADTVPHVPRVSLDAKATVKIGPFARGGTGRVAVTAADHDFRPEATVTLLGLFLPQTDDLFIYHVTSKVSLLLCAYTFTILSILCHPLFAS